MNLDWNFMWTAFPDILSYLPVTFQLTVGALLIAFPVAFLFAWILLKEIPVLKRIVRVYLSLLRGTPVILQIFIIYNIVPALVQQYFNSIGKNINVYETDSAWYAYLALSLSATAFLTEAFRAAVGTIDKGQLEAAYMVGMNFVSAYRSIVLPQAFGVAAPIVGNIIVDVIKATSLAFAMSVTEVTGRAKILGGISLKYFEAYLDIFFVYIVLIGVVEFLLKRLEKHLVRYKNA
ncbi:MAG: amino acid ABC transporter permease [Blautia sp.]|nr:amino acid ABC transporter permease [Blautia sp.]